MQSIVGFNLSSYSHCTSYTRLTTDTGNCCRARGWPFIKSISIVILDYRNIFILKKRNRDWKEKYANKLEIKKVWKQVKEGSSVFIEQRISKNGWLDSSQNRDSKCLKIYFLLIPLFYKYWATSLTCFHTFLISNLFAYFSLSIPIPLL